jgi:hypothetical protein
MMNENAGRYHYFITATVGSMIDKVAGPRTLLRKFQNHSVIDSQI